MKQTIEGAGKRKNEQNGESLPGIMLWGFVEIIVIFVSPRVRRVD